MRSLKHRLVAGFLSCVLAGTALTGLAPTAHATGVGDNSDEVTRAQSASPTAKDSAPAENAEPSESASPAENAEPSEGEADAPVRVIVLLQDQPAAPSESGREQAISEQNSYLDGWKADLGLAVDRQFGYLVNGFSATIPASQIDALRAQPQVKSVNRERLYYPAVNTVREHEGVAAAAKNFGTDGRGMVISIIDTGVDTSHQDLRLDPGVCENSAKIRTINPKGNFTCKVPNGYNYAGQNYDVKDNGPYQHGMHVAGIAAANGQDDSDASTASRVEGIAPNAQLLAMKVFSDKGGAGDSEIIAAIEDSVKLGADVINMSLGFPNGFSDNSDGVNQAISAATNQGVIAIVAAGNSGQNYSNNGLADDFVGRIDDGTISHPAAASDAISVASLENTSITAHTGLWAQGETQGKFAVDIQQGDLPKQLTDLVYVREGDEKGYLVDPTDKWGDDVDVRGKLVLADRATVPFRKMFNEARKRGALGVMVINSEEGSRVSPFVRIGEIENIKLLGASVSYQDGQNLKKLAAEGNLKVLLSKNPLPVKNPGGGLTPSEFTTWGTTAALDFDPDIAGIGGNVYSLQNGNGYTSMSGTSMAAPGISGLAALMAQQLKGSLSGKDLVEEVRVRMLNTAQIPTSADGVPYAPRQIGAGLARVDLALATDVVATVEGSPSVALREIHGDASFTVTLKNRGTIDRAFNIGKQAVVGETEGERQHATKIMHSQTVVTGEELVAGTASVTVPAGGSASVTFTLKPDTSYNHFIEGWARFTSADPAQPELAIPYLGFVGDWNTEAIVAPAGEGVFPDYYSVTKLATNLLQNYQNAKIPYISPNNDGEEDSITPRLAMRRNASDIRYTVLDEAGNELRVIGIDRNVRRETGRQWLSTIEADTLLHNGLTFNGRVWDAAAANFRTIGEGIYSMKIESRLTQSSPWQTIQMPFGVDLTPPDVQFTEGEDGTLTITATDAMSGVAAKIGTTSVSNVFFYWADGSTFRPEVVEESPNRYVWRTKIPDPKAARYASVRVYIPDQAMNVNKSGKVLGTHALTIENRNKMMSDNPFLGIGPFSNAPRVNAKEKTIEIRGFVSDAVASVKVGELEVKPEASSFLVKYPAASGSNTVPVIAYDAEGKELAKETLKFYFDVTPPKLTLSGNLNERGEIIPNADGTVTIRGTIEDDQAGPYQVQIGKGGRFSVPDKTFEKTVDPGNVTSVSVFAWDKLWNAGTASLAIAGRSAGNTPVADSVAFSNMKCDEGFFGCTVAGTTTDYDPATGIFTVKGKYSRPGLKLEFTPRNSAVGGEGSANLPGAYADPAPIAAVSENGTDFTVQLPVKPGSNTFRYRLTTEKGKTVSDLPMAIHFDVSVPSISFTEPQLVDGTLYANSPKVRFKGTISDDGFGYVLAINGSTKLDVFYKNAPGAKSNERSFDEEIRVANGDTVLISATDGNNNMLLGGIPVVVDEVKPEVKVDGAEDIRTSADVITVSASDANLRDLKVLVDGEELSAEVTELASRPITDVRAELVNMNKPANPAKPAAKPASLAGTLAAALPAVEPAEPSDNSANSSQPATNENAESSQTGAASGEEVLGTKTEATQKTLETKVSLADWKAGIHRLEAVSTDLAGNVTTVPVSVTKDDPAIIEGPESVSVELEKLDPAAAADSILSHYRVVDDGSAISQTEPTFTLAPETILVPGENQVKLVATDAAGREVTRTVTVFITVVSSDDADAPGETDPSEEPGQPEPSTDPSQGEPSEEPGMEKPVPGQTDGKNDGKIDQRQTDDKSADNPAEKSPKLSHTGASVENSIGAAVLLTLLGFLGLAARRNRR